MSPQKARRPGRAAKKPVRPVRSAKKPVRASASAKKPVRSRPTVSVSGSPEGRGKFRVQPLRDRVLVRRIEEDEQKVGGIIIPDSAKEKPTRAEVMAVGSGRMLENGKKVPLDLKTGDRVLIGKWSGTEVKVDGQEYLILKEDEILGILG
jgi:chaperonin GroES